jgi:hypothetical protein
MADEILKVTLGEKDIKKMDIIIKFINKLNPKGEQVTRDIMMGGYIQASFEQFTEGMPEFNKFVQEEMGL